MLRATAASLRHATGRNGLHLPITLQASTVMLIKESAPAIAVHGIDIALDFYQKLFARHPELLKVFNKTNQATGAQPNALATTIGAYANHIDGDLSHLLSQGGLLDRIANKHAALDIQPDQYPMVHDCLLDAIKDVMKGKIAPATTDAWSESIMYLARLLVDREELLYKEAEEREGGWRGFAPFVVKQIESPAESVRELTLSPLWRGVRKGLRCDFTAGQFMTLKINDDMSPRHYTVTSRPGDHQLQCMVKLVPGGKVSTFIHEKLAVGDVVDVTPPFGSFVPRAVDRPGQVVLLSAGIGCTPMLNIARHFGPGVAEYCHVDKSSFSIPFKKRNLHPCPDVRFVYSEAEPWEGGMGRPCLTELIRDIVKTHGRGLEYYCCGPPSFMSLVEEAVHKCDEGSRVYVERFASMGAQKNETVDDKGLLEAKGE
jgi:nitric oxide dioxygenase